MNPNQKQPVLKKVPIRIHHRMEEPSWTGSRVLTEPYWPSLALAHRPLQRAQPVHLCFFV